MDRVVAPSAESASDTRAALLARLLADEGIGGDVPSISRRQGAGPAPLSYAQEVLWLLDRASPGQTAYNSPIARRIHGPLRIEAIEHALDAVVARHEALRTVFEQRGEQSLQVVQPAAAVRLTIVDVRAMPAAEREASAIGQLRALADVPFDLVAEPPFRAALARIADDEAILLLLTHHIASDAWSYGVIFRDLAALYDAAIHGTASSLQPVELQFADYAAWQRDHLQGDELEQRLAYWREQLSALPVLELPTTRPPATANGMAGARRQLTLPATLVNRVKQLAQQHGVTPYMVLLAVYQTVFHRYSGQDDITVGSAVAGRTMRETEGMVGYFSQALPMRTRFDGDPTFSDLLARVAGTVLGAFEHQDVPIEALVLELRRAEASGAPLFRVVLTMQEANLGELALSGTAITPVELDASSTKFDLTMLVSERGESLELSLWYRTALFDASAIDRYLGHFRQVLDGAVADPSVRISMLPLLTAPEVSTLTTWETGEHAAPLRETLPSTIAAHAITSPTAIAVVDADTTLTYAELAGRATRLAHRLRALGVTTNTPVGLALERSAEAMVGMLGIWLAGGAYVPLVPELPAARLAQQVAESGVTVVVTIAAHRDRLGRDLTVVALDADADALAAEPVTTLDRSPQRDDLAYVLFTSGSTGTPKGVAVTHGNLAAYVAAIASRLGFSANEPAQFATVSTLGADLGHTAVFPALATGGVLHILSTAVATDPARFVEYMTTHQVDVLKVTPSHLQALVAGRTGAALAAVLPRRWLVLGGEPLPWALAQSLVAARRCRVLNHYGPTETTVGVATLEVTAAADGMAQAEGSQTVPIGRPLPGASLRVLDARGARVPVGIPGELFIGGAGVARGYLNQPERSVERFVPDPFADGDARVYRTGDRVRWLDGGVLEFLGRTDDQVKVRGYRVEPGDIEQALRSHAGVSQSAVLLTEDLLVAYVVPKATSGYAVAHAERLSADAITRFLADRLPEYMVPAAVILLDELPLTPNGKVDRAALRAIDVSAGPATGHVAPRTPTEVAIAAIWGDVFKRDGIGVTDQFLALGGHSLLAIRILGKLTRSFGVRLPLRALFDAPTVEQLARRIDDAAASTPAGA